MGEGDLGPLDLAVAALPSQLPHRLDEEEDAEHARVRVGQPAPVPVAVHNPTSKAVLALVVGILSIPVSWYFSALLCIVLGIVGITAGITGIKSTSKVMAIFGLVLSIIGAALGAVGWILNIVLLAA